MANLSNINNKFLFTDGDFLKIGNLAPINNISGTESGISVTNSNVASITLDNTAASGGKRYVMYSSGNGSLVFWDSDASSARLQIDTSGNSTFVGNVGIGVNPSQKLEVNGAAKWFGATSTDFAQTGGQIDYYDTGRQFRFNAYKADSTGAEIVFNTGGTTSFAQRMVINALGNVGINVTNPGFQSVDGYGQIGIEIKGGKENNQAPCVRLHETGSGKGSFELRSTRNVLTSGNYFAIAEGTDTFFAIRGDDDGGGVVTRGYVGIGTTSPSQKLDVAGNIRIRGTNQGILLDTTGADQAARVLVENDYELVVSTHRGSAGFGVFGNSNIRLGFGTSHTLTETSLLIKSNGNVGIGTDDPGSKLTVVDGSTTFETSDANNYTRSTVSGGSVQLGLFRAGNNIGGGYIGGDGSTCFHVRDASFATKLYLTQAGDLGIGTTSPIGKFNVSKDSTTDGLSQAITVSSSSVSTKRMNLGYVPGSNYAFIDVINYAISNTNQALSLQPNGGNVGIGTTGPSAKLDVDQGSGDWVQRNYGSGNNQGAPQKITITKWYPVTSLGTKLLIPVKSQPNLNATTIVRMWGHSAVFNRASGYTNRSFTLDFTFGSLRAIYSLITLNSSGNISSVTQTSSTAPPYPDGEIQVNFTNSYMQSQTGASYGGVYITLEYMTSNTGKSIIPSGIALN
jgi:hypothetical protein